MCINLYATQNVQSLSNTMKDDSLAEQKGKAKQRNSFNAIFWIVILIIAICIFIVFKKDKSEADLL